MKDRIFEGIIQGLVISLVCFCAAMLWEKADGFMNKMKKSEEALRLQLEANGKIYKVFNSQQEEIKKMYEYILELNDIDKNIAKILVLLLENDGVELDIDIDKDIFLNTESNSQKYLKQFQQQQEQQQQQLSR